MEYRVRSSGELKSQGEIRKLNPNVSLPKVWNDNVYDALGIDPVLETPKPEASGAYKVVVRNGVEQDANDNWVEKWVEQDMFADTSDATKAEQEAAYQATLDADAAVRVRAQRDDLIAATDWRAASDLTLSSDWTTYRQALRDVPGQEGFPHTITWPTAP